MTDTLRTRIADVIWKHQHRDGVGGCNCGASYFPLSHPQHVADAVIRELGLRI